MSENSPTPPVADSTSLLASLIALAPALAARADASFAPLVGARDRLRERLLDTGGIVPVPDAPSIAVDTMCAIDGARVREQMYAADLLVAVATTANAKSSQRSLDPDSTVWANIVRHMDGTDRLAEAAMGCQEVLLGARAPHQIRILDGSFQTPIIAMREGLYVKSAEVRDEVADLLLGEWDPTRALRDLMFPGRRTVIAVPKSDSAVKYAKSYKDQFEIDLPVSDRFLAAQILAPGEMLAPRPLTELASASVREAEGSAKVRQAAEDLGAVVEQAAQASRDGYARTTYFKPTGSAGPGTVLRFEYLVDPASGVDPASATLAAEYAAVLNADMSAPHMMEPFCQWAVDRQAKQIASGTPALRAALIRNLPPEQAEAYGAFLAQNYRT